MNDEYKKWKNLRGKKARKRVRRMNEWINKRINELTKWINKQTNEIMVCND